MSYRRGIGDLAVEVGSVVDIGLVFDFFACVAGIQSEIESLFSFDWNKSDRRIIEMEKYYPVYRSPVVRAFNPFTAIKEEYEDIKMYAFSLYAWPPAVIAFYVGYGSQTNTFVFGGMTEYRNRGC